MFDRAGSDFFHHEPPFRPYYPTVVKSHTPAMVNRTADIEDASDNKEASVVTENRRSYPHVGGAQRREGIIGKARFFTAQHPSGF